MTMAPLACSVRACGAPLTRQERAWVCERGHSYDVGRSGYVNLLQPQDRKSADAGDPREAVDARLRLLDSGIGQPLIDALVDKVATLWSHGAAPVVVELGCGTGHLLRALSAHLPSVGVGIDLSTRAIDIAARRSSTVQWLVANADRRLPLRDGSVDLIVSVHARRNPNETDRVLSADGRALIVIPADDDLIELRRAVQGDAGERDRLEPLLAEHASVLVPLEQWTIREQRTLGAASLRDLLASTYRGARHSSAQRVDALDQLSVTFASNAVLFGRRP